ncbi:MAG: leucyl aminopeptidase [candidate division Zixibacteria bacterium]|nr:leucyl aminopeptidase [candidate division Zixibacteria bacterium]
MDIQVKSGRIGAEMQGTMVVGLFEEDRLEEGSSPVLDPALQRYLRSVLLCGDFKGKKNRLAVLYPSGAAAPARVVLVGLGAQEKFTPDTGRQAAGVAARKLALFGVKDFFSTVHGLDLGRFAPEWCAQATVEGAMLGGYSFNLYKSDPGTAVRLDTLTLMVSQRIGITTLRAGAETGRMAAEATILARDLSNTPGNDLTPSGLADMAAKMAKKNHLRCTVLTKNAIEKEGMGGLLAVSRGSEEPPRFIVLEYGEPAEKRDTLVFVGKGVTFDSGGVSIKPAERMEEMKHDMSGAAAVIGGLQAIAGTKPDVHVVGLIPATENLPSGSALKPGDVIRTLSGKTVEVINTDAEGRLILADALTYAKRFNPVGVVDLATLTGACVVALGHAASGMMGNDPALMDAVRTAGETAGDRVWPLPVWEEHHELIDSHIADVKNTGGRWGGALTAGAFLEKFVDYPWVHLDIAGTAWIEKDGAYCPKGATGAGVRLLVELTRRWRKS